MKKIVLFPLMMAFCLLASTQTRQDMEAVMQLSLDEKGLQKYYEKNKYQDDESFIINADDAVPSYLQLEKFGKPVLFLHTDYLFFYGIPLNLTYTEFTVNEQDAVLEFTSRKHSEKVKITFTKKEETWQIDKMKTTKL